PAVALRARERPAHVARVGEGAEALAQLVQAQATRPARVREEPGVDAGREGPLHDPFPVRLAAGCDVQRLDPTGLQLALELERLLLSGLGQELGLVVAPGADYPAA